MLKLQKIHLGFILVVLYAFCVTILLFVKNPLPLPDRGHRCFLVKNEKAAAVILEILNSWSNTPHRFTFQSGGTIQSVLWDNTTVILQADKKLRNENLATNAFSIVAKNPRVTANHIVLLLQQSGFRAEIIENIDSDVAEKLVMVKSNAMEEWVFIVRKHIFDMGNPQVLPMPQ